MSRRPAKADAGHNGGRDIRAAADSLDSPSFGTSDKDRLARGELLVQTDVVKSYLLKLNEREEGPYPDTQIAQMFADQRIDRYTPCRPDTGGDWRTIDDYLPTLKYGTQLPQPAARPASMSRGGGPAAPQKIALVDLDIPFGSILKMMFKWAGAGLIVGLCIMPIVLLIWFVIVVVFAGVIGGAFSGSR